MSDRCLAGECVNDWVSALASSCWPASGGQDDSGRLIAPEHLGAVVLDLDRPSDRARLGVGVPPETLHRFWRMLAHLHGQLFRAAQSGGALGGVAHTTVARYLDIMSIR